MRTLSKSPTSASAKGVYARATMHTLAVLADPSASLMDRLHAAEAEEAACMAAREAAAELARDPEAGI
jgi:hypothetical protein